ncbi:hypothetical protein [Streptomyces sp. NPDC090026]|uniref:hypothetical protein n=1 Tax=Streptomyces sp. NPDC090026 TaxID=3365923 RepID=UPI0037FE7689
MSPGLATRAAISGVRGWLPDPLLCWEELPGNATRHCTIEDPLHDGDHHHEYSGVSWPRRPGGQR